MTFSSPHFSHAKEWRALPKEERDNYTKTEPTKGVVERVSYAKVWGERAKDKSQYLVLMLASSLLFL